MTASPIEHAGLDDSVLIVAHPDDEILWFGSVVNRVDRIVICFLHDPGNAALADNRRRVLAEHPLRDRIECLELEETRAFGHADWIHPVETESGLDIERDQSVVSDYRERARQLETLLRPHIDGARNIFTHNPWGEYGHEEHVMVHRVVAALVGNDDARAIWFSNYASSWSTRLMQRHLTTDDTPVFNGDVDVALMEGIAGIYRRCDAWTWFDDYRWFEKEYFVQGPLEARPQPGFGWLFPVKLIHLPDRVAPRPAPGLLERARGFLRRRFGRRQGNAEKG